MSSTIEYIGVIAGMLTTLSFLPQVIKIWRTKDVTSISLLMYSSFCLGVLLWLIYGVVISSFSLILTNVVTFMLASCILFLKITLKQK